MCKFWYGPPAVHINWLKLERFPIQSARHFSAVSVRGASMISTVKFSPGITIKSKPLLTRSVRQLARNIRSELRDLVLAEVLNEGLDNLELENCIPDAKVLKEMTELLCCIPGIENPKQDCYLMSDVACTTEKCIPHLGGMFEGEIFSVRRRLYVKNTSILREVLVDPIVVDILQRPTTLMSNRKYKARLYC